MLKRSKNTEIPSKRLTLRQNNLHRCCAEKQNKHRTNHTNPQFLKNFPLYEASDLGLQFITGVLYLQAAVVSCVDVKPLRPLLVVDTVLGILPSLYGGH